MYIIDYIIDYSDEENSDEKNSNENDSDEENKNNTNTAHIQSSFLKLVKNIFYNFLCMYKNG